MSTSGLARYLIKEGLLSESDCHLIARDNGNTGAAFAKVVVSLGVLTEEKLAQFLVQKTKLPMIPHNQFCTVKPGAESALALPLMKTLEVIPVELHNNQLTVAMADPLDQDTLQQLRFFTDFRIKPVIATFTTLYKSLENLVQGFSPEKTTLQKLLALYTPRHAPDESPGAQNMAFKDHHQPESSVPTNQEEPDEGFWDESDTGTEAESSGSLDSEGSLNHDELDQFDEFEQENLDSGLDDFEDEVKEEPSGGQGISKSIIEDEDFPLDSDESQAAFSGVDLDDPWAADPLPDIDPELLPGEGPMEDAAQDDGLESWDDVMGDGEAIDESSDNEADKGQGDELSEAPDDQLWDDQGQVLESDPDIDNISATSVDESAGLEGDLFSEEDAQADDLETIADENDNSLESSSEIAGLDQFFDEEDSPEPASGSEDALKAPTQLAGDEVPEDFEPGDGEFDVGTDTGDLNEELTGDSLGDTDSLMKEVDEQLNEEPDEVVSSDLSESMEEFSEEGGDTDLDSFLDENDSSAFAGSVEGGNDLLSEQPEEATEGASNVALAVETKQEVEEVSPVAEDLSELEELGHEIQPDQNDAIDQLSSDISQLAKESLDLETSIPVDEEPFNQLADSNLSEEEDKNVHAKKHELGIGFLNHALAGVSLAMSREKADEAMAQGMTKAGIKKGVIYKIKDDQVIYVNQWGNDPGSVERIGQARPDLSRIPAAKPGSLWIKLVETPDGLESLVEDGCELMAHWGPENAQGQGLTLAGWEPHAVGHEGLHGLSGGLMNRYIKKSA